MKKIFKNIKCITLILPVLLVSACYPVMIGISRLDPFPSMHFNHEMMKAEEGNPDSQATVAKALEDACHPSHPDSWAWRPSCDKAACFKWYHLAAKNGNARAQERLGFLYRRGEVCGIEKNIEEGLGWHYAAADQGYVPAILTLAKFYAEGLHVKKDEVKAVEWYQKAAEKDDSYAQMILAERYAAGQGVRQDAEKARYWGLKAVQKRSWSWGFEFGVMCAEIDPPDYEEAYYWTSLARARRNVRGGQELIAWPAQEIEKHLGADQIASIQKRLDKEIALFCKNEINDAKMIGRAVEKCQPPYSALYRE